MILNNSNKNSNIIKTFRSKKQYKTKNILDLLRA